MRSPFECPESHWMISKILWSSSSVLLKKGLKDNGYNFILMHITGAGESLRRNWSGNLFKHQRILFVVSKTTSNITRHFKSGTAPLYHSLVVTSLHYNESYPILLVKSSSVSNSWREQLSILIPRALLTCSSSSWAKRWLWVVILKVTEYGSFKPSSYVKKNTHLN